MSSGNMGQHYSKYNINLLMKAKKVFEGKRLFHSKVIFVFSLTIQLRTFLKFIPY